MPCGGPSDWAGPLRGQQPRPPASGSRSASSQPRLAARRPRRSPPAPVAWYAPSTRSCRCGTGTSASTASGAADRRRGREALAEEFLAGVATKLFVGRIPTRQQPTWVHLRRPWKPASSRLLVALPTPACRIIRPDDARSPTTGSRARMACPVGRTSGARLITLRSHRGHGELKKVNRSTRTPSTR